jgi:hypothetical protein
LNLFRTGLEADGASPDQHTNHPDHEYPERESKNERCGEPYNLAHDDDSTDEKNRNPPIVTGTA